MTQAYRTLRVAPADEGVLGVVIDAPPMNLVGPELVHDLAGLLSALQSDQETRVVVLESADPDYFVPHVDLTKVAEYTAEAARAGGPDDASPARTRARTTSAPSRPNGTAGSTGPCRTPTWTHSWPGSRGASRRSPPARCDRPSACSMS
jgi:hypothetical protein